MATETFEDIYRNHRWGVNYDGDPSSGPGSHPNNVIPYVRFVQDFMRLHDVRTVVDVGCGDWQFARLMNWDGVEYLGIDCVKSVLQRNKKRFAAENIDFAVGDLTLVDDLEHFPAADLYLVKDVLQHLPSRFVYSFLDALSLTGKAKYMLVTNCCDQIEDNDPEGFVIGETRPLHSSKLPLSKYHAREQICFYTKQTSLIHGGERRKSVDTE